MSNFAWGLTYALIGITAWIAAQVLESYRKHRDDENHGRDPIDERWMR